MSSHKTLAISLAIVIGLGALFAAAVASWQKSRPQETQPTVQPSMGKVREVMTSKGNVSYKSQVSIKTQIQGRVDKISVREGQAVKAGQVLLQINDPDANNELSARDMDQSKLIAKIDALTRDVADIGRLVAAGASPRSELDQKRLELDFARTDLGLAKLDKAKLEQAQSRNQVRSPFDGILIQLPISQGQWVHVREELAVLAGGSKLQIVAYVDASDLPRLTVGQAVDFSDQPDSEKFRRGRISSIGDVVDSAQRQNSVRVVIDPSDALSGLRFSQQLYLEFVIHEASNVLRIPRGYARQEQDQTVVYVVEQTGIKARAIKLGSGDRHFDQVTSGLQLSDRLVHPTAPKTATR